MILDCHVHVGNGQGDTQRLLAEMKQAKVDAAVILSAPPASFIHDKGGPRGAAERIEHILQWTRGSDKLYPFFWIDPTEDLFAVFMSQGPGQREYFRSQIRSLVYATLT